MDTSRKQVLFHHSNVWRSKFKLFSPSFFSLIGVYGQSAAIQVQKSPVEEIRPSDGLLLSLPSTFRPPNHELVRTQLPPALGLPVSREYQLRQPFPGPSRQGVEDVDGEGVRVGTGVSKIAEQGSGSGRSSVSTHNRSTRRGSPRPSTHDRFDINEHLPWMIVLLLLLVLVVIVVCSVKRSSRVLKKGPMQDPSSIVEKAIQKKPSTPQRAQVKEKWIYYSNGQGESDFFFFHLKVCFLVASFVSKRLRNLSVLQNFFHSISLQIMAIVLNFDQNHS